MKADDVARYLRENPLFFEKYADMLAGIHVPHPHGGGAIPLSDRQLLALREKNKALELRLAVLYLHLREDFAVPHSALRVWRSRRDAPWGKEEAAEFRPVGTELKRYAASLAQPYCGPSGLPEAAAWFGEGASHVRSVAHMALRDQDCFGMLALGSEDVQRFFPEMGTLYLKRLGGLASAALLRFL